MNQEQLKQVLLKLQPDTPEFSVIFSGKKSRKVDGLYYPETCELIIHNRNFTGENGLVVTGIHEFAHHVHCTSSPVSVSSRSHTGEYWTIFHQLLKKAESMGLYEDIASSNSELAELTAKIKQTVLKVDGELMKEFGSLLVKARELCQKNEVCFEDYINRVLAINKGIANNAIQSFQYDHSPDIGFENMKILNRIKDPGSRKQAENLLASGESPFVVRSSHLPPTSDDDPVKKLLSEKKRITRTIENLTKRLEEVEHKLEVYE